MLDKLTNQLSPKAVTAIKVGAILLGIAAGVVVVGVVLNKTGLLQTELFEEVTEVPVSPAS